MNRIYAVLGLVVLSILGVNAARGQEPNARSTDVTCATFLVDTSEVYSTPAKMRANLDTIAKTHATEVERWLEERATGGQSAPVYRASVGVLARGVTSEVVCVR